MNEEPDFDGYWLQAREQEQQPYTLHSGRTRPLLVNAGQLYAAPAVRAAVFGCWAAFLEAQCINGFRLVAIPTGGNAWAEGFRQYLNDLNDHTSALWGGLPVIVDDVVTTGASIREARERLGVKAPALVVVDRRCGWSTPPLPDIDEPDWCSECHRFGDDESDLCAWMVLDLP